MDGPVADLDVGKVGGDKIGVFLGLAQGLKTDPKRFERHFQGSRLFLRDFDPNRRSSLNKSLKSNELRLKK